MVDGGLAGRQGYKQDGNLRWPDGDTTHSGDGCGCGCGCMTDWGLALPKSKATTRAYSPKHDDFLLALCPDASQSRQLESRLEPQQGRTAIFAQHPLISRTLCRLRFKASAHCVISDREQTATAEVFSLLSVIGRLSISLSYHTSSANKAPVHPPIQATTESDEMLETTAMLVSAPPPRSTYCPNYPVRLITFGSS